MPHTPSSRRRLDPVGLLWATAAAGLWGTLGIVGKWLYGYGVAPLPLMAVRASIAAVFLGLVLLVVSLWGRGRGLALLRVAGRDLPFFALYGLVSVAGNYLTYFLALQQVGAILAVTVFYTYPVMATLLAVVFLREPLTLRRALPLPLTFLGCALVAGLFSPAELSPRPAGIAWALTAAATFALYSIFGRRALSRYSPWTTLFYSIAFGALFLDLLWAGLCPFLGSGDFCGGVPALATLPFWVGVLYLALGPTLGAYLSYLLALRRLEVRQASLVTSLELVVAAVLAALLLGERMSIAQWLGTALILSAVLWLRTERTAAV